MNIINNINDWVTGTFGGWVSTYAGIIFAAALIAVFILLVAVIIVGACNASKKKKIKKLKSGEEPTDEQKLREEIKAELEKDSQSNAKDADEARAAADASSRYNDELRGTIAERDKTIAELKEQNGVLQTRIDELGAMLGKANSSGQVNNDLYRQLNELNQTNKELENENNLLKAENAQIKAKALQEKLASNSQPTAQKAAASKKEEPADDDDDEYDEYYDDYGDESSLVKVTVKFDRVKNNWVVLRSDTDRTYRRLATKQEALTIAKDLARRLHAQLVVHKKDGKFQKI